MTNRRTTAADNGHVLDVGRIDPDPTIGDIVETSISGPTPVIDTGETRSIDVLVNMTYGREPHGHRCIRIKLPTTGFVSAAEAHQLTVDLAAAKDVVAGIRTDLGYNQ
jgi:hypothetical protein